MRVPFLALRNPIRSYAWGSHTAIPELLGQPSPSVEPQAELWMGDHPQAPSDVCVDGGWISLREWIARDPKAVVGAGGDGSPGDLPFLFKVLAAGQPLSIQTHPDAAQARAGFAREEALGIPRDAPHRNYRDTNPKPEILYALTPFHVLRGFRSTSAILGHFDRAGLADFEPLGALTDGGLDPSVALERFFRRMMDLPQGTMDGVLERLMARAATEARDDSRAVDSRYEDPLHWIPRFLELYPGDRGALGPLYLELFTLQPGQAIHTGPGVPHAYLDGCGIELMVSSDNVLRCGLTPKHVDVPELVSVLRFEPQPPMVLDGSTARAGERLYAYPEGGLLLSRLDVTARTPAVVGDSGGPEILLCTEGRAIGRSAEESLEVRRGDSFLVPAASQPSTLEGEATLFRARACDPSAPVQ